MKKSRQKETSADIVLRFTNSANGCILVVYSTVQLHGPEQAAACFNLLLIVSSLYFRAATVEVNVHHVSRG